MTERTGSSGPWVRADGQAKATGQARYTGDGSASTSQPAGVDEHLDLDDTVTPSGERERSHSPKNSSARPYERAASSWRTPAS